MENIKVIEKRIEKLRKEMHELLKTKTFTDREVIRKSTEIDALVNEYMKLVKEKNQE